MQADSRVPLAHSCTNACGVPPTLVARMAHPPRGEVAKQSLQSQVVPMGTRQSQTSVESRTCSTSPVSQCVHPRSAL